MYIPHIPYVFHTFYPWYPRLNSQPEDQPDVSGISGGPVRALADVAVGLRGWFCIEVPLYPP